MEFSLPKRCASEGLGTGMLLATVVGSGIMAERLAQGNEALALLANSIATGTVLAALILSFGAISGAHLNPAVTLSEAIRGRLAWGDAYGYLVAQTTGALAGTGYANLMFDLPVYAVSGRERAGAGLLFAEVIATFGLVAVIQGSARSHALAVGPAVGAYIAGAYWFTSSTSFANPAVTVARTLSDTFTGIRPVDAPGFILAECLGAGMATLLFWWLATGPESAREEVRGE